MAIPRSSQSSAQLRAVAAEEEILVSRIEKRLAQAAVAGVIDLSGGIKDLAQAAIATIARICRGYAHDAIVASYSAGGERARDIARIELGFPIDRGPAPDACCPTCRRPIE